MTTATTWLNLLLILGLTPPDEPPKKEFPAAEIRQVVEAIVEAAEKNAARPRDQLRGDALADYYVRRAAQSARSKRLPPPVLLLGLGVALDDTSLLRNNFLTRPYLRQVESDAERARRLRSIGSPTLRNRHDWLLHFWVSAALTAHVGAETAEQIGITKELMDARGGSGFSFGDLAADFAGVSFARQFLADKDSIDQRLRHVADLFKGNQYLPAVEDLEEGLKMEQFMEKYGGVKDARFLRACEVIRARISEAPGQKEPKESGKK